MHQSPPILREPPAPATGASPTAGYAARLGRAAAIAGIAGVFLALAGAFGSQQAPLPTRLAYWVVTMVLASALGMTLYWFAEARGWLERRPVLGVAAVAGAMAIPVTGLVWLLTGLFYHQPMQAQALPGLFPIVLLVCLIMTAINHLAAERAPRRHETHAAVAGSAPVKFLERIPLKLRGGELYAVQAEDHYLRLHTSKGSDLILMRLADAVAELEGIEGAQVHRSWWVARAAVTDARRADGRAMLTLKGGVPAPVSRSYAGALRDGGWF